MVRDWNWALKWYMFERQTTVPFPSFLLYLFSFAFCFSRKKKSTLECKTLTTRKALPLFLATFRSFVGSLCLHRKSSLTFLCQKQSSWQIVFYYSQIRENYLRKNTDGISIQFLLFWIFGDILNLFGVILDNLLFTMVTIFSILFIMCFNDSIKLLALAGTLLFIGWLCVDGTSIVL